MKRLENKIAVNYSDGRIGGAIAKSFAEAGATVFFTGRTIEKLDAIANEISSNGGIVETAKLDALDEKAVEEHIIEVTKKTGNIDISFNTIGIPQKGIQGIPLTGLSVGGFLFSYRDIHAFPFYNCKGSGRPTG